MYQLVEWDKYASVKNQLAAALIQRDQLKALLEEIALKHRQLRPMVRRVVAEITGRTSSH